MKSQAASVNAAKRVVSITVLEVRVPSCPILRAITYELTVVAEPSITRIAISSSLLKPEITARGRKIETRSTSFIAAANTDAPALFFARAKSKEAPIAIRPIGVAIEPMLDTAFEITAGVGIFAADHTRPRAIAMIIGFFIMPSAVFFTSATVCFSFEGEKKESTQTAIML